jgi:membrane-bound lytic murein transglycosylase B
MPSAPLRALGRAPGLLPLLAALLLLCARAEAAEGLPTGGLLHTPFGAQLTDRLVADGFPRARVEALLDDPRTQVLGKTVAYAIVYRETKASYDQFLTEERLGRARAFFRENRALLDAAAGRTGVPGEVITAILMIESDFGSFRSIYPISNVFLSLLWAAQPENFGTVRGIVQQRLPDVTPEKVREKSQAKARWAYEQLGFLLRIAEREKIDPLALEGSWAGAFGLPQFIPSSYWSYAVDGDEDHRVELFNKADAVYSVGNYLRAFGWRDNPPLEKRRTAIRRYNNSDLYVDTVLAAAARLRETPAGTP